MLTCGCAKEDAALEEALNFRTSLLSAGGCRYSADVTADLGEKTYEFSVDCVYDETEGTVTVTSPESIAGITAAVSGDEAQLRFDGLALTLDGEEEGWLSPMAAAWTLGTAWETDYISAGGDDGGRYRMTILKGYDEEEIQIDTWLEDGIPVRSEVSCGGERILTAVIREFGLGPGE